MDGYRSKFRSWLTFCAIHGLDALELDCGQLELALCAYVDYLVGGLLTFAVVKDYAKTAVTRFFKVHGFTLDLKDFIYLGRVLDGYSQVMPEVFKQGETREPVQAHHIMAMAASMDWSDLIDVQFMFMQALLLYGCRRLGELCRRTIDEFDPKLHLTAADVIFHEDRLEVVFDTTKTRPKPGNPLHVFIARQRGDHPFCAWRLGAAFVRLARHKGADAPLFQRIKAGRLSGQPFLSAMFVRHMQKEILRVDPSAVVGHYTGHSFRIAAATLMELLGVSKEVRKTVGDWVTDSAANLYVRTAPSQQLEATGMLADLFDRVSAC